jgi:hypothetical protein
VLAASAAAGLLGSNRCADAADMPLKAARETSGSQYNWTGFYAGVHGGEAWGSNRFNDPTFSFSPISFEVTSQGPLAGGQLGFNWQAGYFVIGAEADFDWAELRGDYVLNPTVAATEVSSSIRALATGTGRVGVAMGPWLAYGKGGVAWTDVEFTTNLFNSTVVSVIQQRTGRKRSRFNSPEFSAPSTSTRESTLSKRGSTSASAAAPQWRAIERPSATKQRKSEIVQCGTSSNLRHHAPFRPASRSRSGVPSWRQRSRCRRRRLRRR